MTLNPGRSEIRSFVHGLVAKHNRSPHEFISDQQVLPAQVGREIAAKAMHHFGIGMNGSVNEPITVEELINQIAGV